MSDQDIILEAYAESLRRLFFVYSENTMLAANAAARTKIEEQFKAGLLNARKMRDRALQLVA